MHRYIKTSYLYLLPCIPPAVYLIYVMIPSIIFEEENQEVILWFIIYIAMVTVCIFETAKERKRMSEILSSEYCKEGVVERLQEIRRETSYGPRFHMEETVAYRIVVKVRDEFGGSKFYYSDEISRWRKNHIFPVVKVYQNGDDTCVIYENSKEKIRYNIEKTRDIMRVQPVRAFLVFVNKMLYLGVLSFLFWLFIYYGI